MTLWTFQISSFCFQSCIWHLFNQGRNWFLGEKKSTRNVFDARPTSAATTMMTTLQQKYFFLVKIVGEDCHCLCRHHRRRRRRRYRLRCQHVHLETMKLNHRHYLRSISWALLVIVVAAAVVAAAAVAVIVVVAAVCVVVIVVVAAVVSSSSELRWSLLDLKSFVLVNLSVWTSPEISTCGLRSSRCRAYVFKWFHNRDLFRALTCDSPHPYWAM